MLLLSMTEEMTALTSPSPIIFILAPADLIISISSWCLSRSKTHITKSSVLIFLYSASALIFDLRSWLRDTTFSFSTLAEIFLI